MPYTAFHITVDAHDNREALLGLLPEWGIDGIEETDDRIIAYAKRGSINLEHFSEHMERLHFQYTIEEVEDQNWNQAWESNFEPVLISGKIQVRASFHAQDDSVPFSILITPKMSFGTGHHATTRMMLSLMLEHTLQDKSVLDFGTGTGVLAILAEKMGAREIVAIDNDEWSITNAAENVLYNHCTRISVMNANSVHLLGMFDAVLANINKHVLLEQAEALAQRLASKGTLIISGLLSSDYGEILKKYYPLMGHPVVQVVENDWLALGFSKP